MQAVIFSFFFGVTCALVLWAAGSAAITRDRLMREYGFSPTREV